MLAPARRPFNPNRSSTDVTGWNSGDLSAFLAGVNTNRITGTLNNDVKISNKNMDYYQTAPKRELVAEIISTFNINQLKLLDGIFHMQTCNDRLLCVTKNRNNTVVQLRQKMQYLENKMNSLYSLLLRAKQSLPHSTTQINTTKNISSIDDDSNKLVFEENLTVNTIHSQTLLANPCVSNFNTTKKANENTNIKVKSPSADLAVSDLNENISTQRISANPRLSNISQTSPIQSIKITKSIQPTPQSPPIKPHLGHITNKIKNKKKKQKHINNRSNNKSNIKSKNKNKKQRNKQRTPSKHLEYEVSNSCTSMVLPYIANKQRKKRYYIINPIREDIDIKTRYGIYRTSKCLEKQIHDILPYEDYTKDEQHAYDELNEKINYAVFNR